MSSSPARVCVAFGTRPEAHKMAPVVHALAARTDVDPRILVTGQHREQLDQSLRIFGLVPDADLDVMTPSQTLPDLLARIVPAAAERLRALDVRYVLVHGDTLSTFAVALAAFYEGLPVAHVEAGLRSFDLAEPFPEEANRRLTDVLTDLDLPPTPLARTNLAAEGKDPARMVVTGNTAVDAALEARGLAQLPAIVAARVQKAGGRPSDGRAPSRTGLVAITMHRRENLAVMPALAGSLARIAVAHPRRTFVFPMHRNPAVRDAVLPALSGLDNVILADPYDYLEMLALLDRSDLIITDSGGIQEEGAALGVPVAVLRNVTERPEGVAAGTLVLLGNDPLVVEQELALLLGDEGRLARMRARPNPYGDGRAGVRVAQAVAWSLGLDERPEDWVPAPTPTDVTPSRQGPA